jgi:hypothetical protein
VTALGQTDHVNDYTLFTDAPALTEELATIAPVRLVATSKPTIDAAAANRSRSLGDSIAMSRALSDHAIDLLLFPTAYSYVPVVSRAKKVVVIHDLTAERYPGPNGRVVSRWLWNIKSMMSRRQADAMATVSIPGASTSSARPAIRCFAVSRIPSRPRSWSRSVSPARAGWSRTSADSARTRICRA